MPNFMTKALAVRKLKGKENCENEHREKANFLYNFVQKTKATKATYTCTRIRFQKDPFPKRSVLGCPHVPYVNPETPFTRTWIDPGKLASNQAQPLLIW